MITPVTLSQTIFLNIKFFLQNRLLSYACACSFNFLFSFIPVSMMITVILIRILHTTPEVAASLINMFPEIPEYIDTNSIIENVQATQHGLIVEVILGIFVFWMARRFFATTFDSLQNIFHTHTKRKAVMNQVLTLAVEVLLIFIVAMMIFIYVSMRAILDTPFITNMFKGIPQISFIFNGVIVSNFIEYFPNLLIFIALLTLYKLVPGTTPQTRICVIAALACTITFFTFRVLLHSFLNTSNYNMVYGVLSQIIITLMDIQFFFTFFLFFAQTIYVYQFFNEHLLAELYLLPKKQKVGLLSRTKMKLFIRPDYLIAIDANVMDLKKDEILYKPGDETEGAYYIVSGRISEERNGEAEIMEQGDFFGDIGCIIKKPRNSTVKATENSRIIKIKADDFVRMAKKNSKAMRKIISKISSNFSFMDEHED